jgi:hypothetical protein
MESKTCHFAQKFLTAEECIPSTFLTTSSNLACSSLRQAFTRSSASWQGDGSLADESSKHLFGGLVDRRCRQRPLECFGIECSPRELLSLEKNNLVRTVVPTYNANG